MNNASTELKSCNQCKELIKGEILTALGKTWHPMHFCCNACNEPISERVFSTEKNIPYCSRCYNKLFLNTCHCCGESLTNKYVKALGVYWHEDHLLCKQCKTKLIGTEFAEVQGEPCCRKCYFDKYAPRCKACCNPISDKLIFALDAKWHQTCFKCSRCENLISKDQTFLVDAGKPHCIECKAVSF